MIINFSNISKIVIFYRQKHHKTAFLTLIFADERYLYRVTETFADLLADGFGDADDVADVAGGILDAHIDHAAAIRFAVEGGLHLEASFAVFLADINWHHYICGIHVAAALDCGFESVLHIILMYPVDGAYLFKHGVGPSLVAGQLVAAVAGR